MIVSAWLKACGYSLNIIKELDRRISNELIKLNRNPYNLRNYIELSDHKIKYLIKSLNLNHLNSINTFTKNILIPKEVIKLFQNALFYDSESTCFNETKYLNTMQAENKFQHLLEKYNDKLKNFKLEYETE